jgi:hypothetical protein
MLVLFLMLLIALHVILKRRRTAKSCLAMFKMYCILVHVLEVSMYRVQVANRVLS